MQESADELRVGNNRPMHKCFPPSYSITLRSKHISVNLVPLVALTMVAPMSCVNIFLLVQKLLVKEDES